MMVTMATQRWPGGFCRIEHRDVAGAFQEVKRSFIGIAEISGYNVISGRFKGFQGISEAFQGILGDSRRHHVVSGEFHWASWRFRGFQGISRGVKRFQKRPRGFLGMFQRSQSCLMVFSGCLRVVSREATGASKSPKGVPGISGTFQGD